jgi:hypothetical protein
MPSNQTEHGENGEIWKGGKIFDIRFSYCCISINYLQFLSYPCNTQKYTYIP